MLVRAKETLEALQKARNEVNNIDTGDEDAEDEVAISIKDITNTLLTSDRRLMKQPTTKTSLVMLLVTEM